MSFVLVPIGMLLVLPRLLATGQDAPSVPVGSMAQAVASVVLSLGLGIALAPRAKRYPKTVKVMQRISIPCVFTTFVVFLSLVGLPPVSLVSVACSAAFVGLGVLLALGLALFSRQPAPNVWSMVLEINVRDVAMANVIVLVGFGSMPFDFKYEAFGVIAIFTTVVTHIFLGIALVRMAYRAYLRRCCRPDDSLLGGGDVAVGVEDGRGPTLQLEQPRARGGPGARQRWS